MTRSSYVQLKAVLLLLLLAGHEAVRISEDVHVASHAQELAAAAGPVKQWNTENEVCKWNWLKFRCDGPAGGSVDGFELPGCEDRPLPLDLPGGSCRLTDNYMLAPERAVHFFKLQTQVLESSADTFKFHNCNSPKLFDIPTQLGCARRTKHIMRIMQFLASAESNAQTSELIKSLPAEDLAEHKAQVTQAMADMTTGLGDNGNVVQMLQQKLRNAKERLVTANPQEAVSRVISLMVGLLLGNKEQQDACKQAIEEMPDQPSEVAVPPNVAAAMAIGEAKAEEEVKANGGTVNKARAEDVAARLQQSVQQNGILKFAEQQAQKLESGVDQQVALYANENSASLVQMASNSSAVDALREAARLLGIMVAIVVTVYLLVLIGHAIFFAMLVWAIIATSACIVAKVLDIAGDNIFVCIGKITALPFVVVGVTAAVAIAVVDQPNRRSWVEVGNATFADNAVSS